MRYIILILSLSLLISCADAQKPEKPQEKLIIVPVEVLDYQIPETYAGSAEKQIQYLLNNPERQPVLRRVDAVLPAYKISTEQAKRINQKFK